MYEKKNSIKSFDNFSSAVYFVDWDPLNTKIILPDVYLAAFFLHGIVHWNCVLLDDMSSPIRDGRKMTKHLGRYFWTQTHWWKPKLAIVFCFWVMTKYLIFRVFDTWRYLRDFSKWDKIIYTILRHFFEQKAMVITNLKNTSQILSCDMKLCFLNANHNWLIDYLNRVIVSLFSNV